MKSIKKVTAITLVVAMVMSLMMVSTSVFAADSAAKVSVKYTVSDVVNNSFDLTLEAGSVTDNGSDETYLNSSGIEITFDPEVLTATDSTDRDMFFNRAVTVSTQ